MVSNDALGGGRRSRSVERAFTVLSALASSPEPLGVSALARLTELPKSTVHLSLQTMRELGFVEQEDGSDRYVLGIRAAQIGVRALDRSSVARALTPRMRRLAERSGEAVSLGIRVEDAVVFIERFETAHRLGTNIAVGSRMPLHASASGKCLLAAMADPEIHELYPDEQLPSQSTNTIRDRAALLEELAVVRARGHAFNTDEFLDGVSAVAVPVRFGDRVAGSLSIAGPTTRFRASEWVDDLHELVAEWTPSGGWDGHDTNGAPHPARSRTNRTEVAAR